MSNVSRIDHAGQCAQYYRRFECSGEVGLGSGRSSVINFSRRSLVVAGTAGLLVPQVWAQAASDAIANLPLLSNENDHVIVPVTINGEACLAMIDNGASLSILDQSYATEKSIAATDTATVGGKSVGATNKQSVKFGPVNATMPLMLGDLSMLRTSAGDRVHMIVGRNLLSVVFLLIDRSSQKVFVTVNNGKIDISGPSATKLDLEVLQGGAELVPIDVEGKPLRALVDLGSGSALMLRQSEQTADWLKAGRRSTFAFSFHMEGSALVQDKSSAELRVSNMTIGPHTLKDIPTELYRAEDMPFGTYEAVIGAPVWKRFATGLDSRNAKLVLAPASGFKDPFRFPTIGLATQQAGDRVKVLAVGVNSPAEAAGFRAGDEIVAINGEAPKREVLRDAPAGMKFDLKLADGKVRSFISAEYY